MSATYFPNSSVFFEPLSSSGLGDDAQKVQSLLSQLSESTPESFTLGKPKKDTLERLYEIFTETCQAGWDGYGAAPASFESYLKTKQFLEALPTGFPTPEVAMDPDGEVSLEWYHSPGRVFSVSIGAADSLSYAGLFGCSKTHGSETFFTSIPKVILDNIRRLHS